MKFLLHIDSGKSIFELMSFASAVAQETFQYEKVTQAKHPERPDSPLRCLSEASDKNDGIIEMSLCCRLKNIDAVD